jgi:hypothetical protein
MIDLQRLYHMRMRTDDHICTSIYESVSQLFLLCIFYKRILYTPVGGRDQ